MDNSDEKHYAELAELYSEYIDENRRKWHETMKRREKLAAEMAVTMLQPYESRYAARQSGVRQRNYFIWLAKERYPEVYEKYFPRTGATTPPAKNSLSLGAKQHEMWVRELDAKISRSAVTARWSAGRSIQNIRRRDLRLLLT